ncbi:MAG: O-antigen ligase family protein [bacterium]|nr:O-antigen ligase family protein [bacterium]
MNFVETWRSRLLILVLFLLPWQTRFIFGFESLHSGISEFGVLSLFATELLIVISFVVQPFIKHHKWFDWTTILGWMMILAALASIAQASNQSLAVMAWLHVLASYLLFLSILNENIRPSHMLYAFSLGLVAPAVLGIYQAISGVSPSSTIFGMAAHDASIAGTSVIETFSIRWLRAYGSFQHPNIFGGYLAVGLFSVFMLPRWFKGVAHKTLIYTMAILFVATLILTYSRSAWLGFVLSFLITGWMLFTHNRVAMRRVMPFGLIVLVIAMLTVTLFIQPVATRFDSTARLETQSLEERLEGFEQWKGVTTYNDETSGRVIEGVGIGNYTVALEEAYPDRSIYAYQPVHNLYLLIFSEIGLIGVLFVLLWAGSIGRINYSQIPRIPAVGTLAMGNIILIIGFFDHYIWSLWPGLALLAYVMAMTCRLSEPDVEKLQ